MKLLRLRYYLFLGLIVLLGLGLRLDRFATFPSISETADERAWAWLGASLIQERQPTAWSYFLAYKKLGFIYQENDQDQAPLVRPFLDHPPLFALIPGSMHLLQAKTWQAFPSQKAIRFPMVFIGALNIFLLGVALKLYFPKKDDQAVNLLTTLVFASLPLIVFSSRMAVADNFLATWSLLSLILVKKGRLRWLWLLLVLAVLTKVQGLFIAGGVGLYFWLTDQKKQSVLALVSGVFGLVLFEVYGALYNQKLFLEIFLSQGQRKIGLSTLAHRFFFYPTLASHLWPTLSKPLLFLAGVIITTKAKLKKGDPWLLPASLFVSFLALTLLAVGEVNINGWYDYAIFPSLFFGVRLVIDKLRQRPTPLALAVLYFLVFMPLLHIFLTSLTNEPAVSYNLTKLAILVAFGFFSSPRSIKLNRYLFYLLIFSLVSLSSLTILSLDQAHYSQLIFYLSSY